MSAYRSTVKGSVQFDGATVQYELKRISFEAAIEMRKADLAQTAQLVQAHVLTLNGVVDADGAAVPIEAVFRDFYFSKLVSHLVGELLETGAIPKAAVDPSAGSSSAGSPANGSPQAQS